MYSDIHGAIKSVTIPNHKLEEALTKDLWFDGSSIQGFTRIEESDMFLRPDANTYGVLPWSRDDRKVGRLICDVYSPDGKPFEGDPRYILKRVLKKASKMGFTYNVGPEIELFLFERKDGASPVVHDSAGYFDASPSDLGEGVKDDFLEALAVGNG